VGISQPGKADGDHLKKFIQSKLYGKWVHHVNVVDVFSSSSVFKKLPDKIT
jgi:hypothetical protein